VAEGDQAADDVVGRPGVVGAGVRHQSGVGLPATDVREREALPDELGQVPLVVVQTEQDAPVRDPEPAGAVVEQPSPAVAHRCTGEQQQVQTLRLRLALDADQQRVEEVAPVPREDRLVGEHADDVVAATCQALSDRVGGVARAAHHVHDASPGLLPHPSHGIPGQDVRHGRLADAGEAGHVRLGHAVVGCGPSLLLDAGLHPAARR
jgi:hypothetical protein